MPRSTDLAVLVGSAVVPIACLFAGISDASIRRGLMLNMGVSFLAFLGTVRMIPVVSAYTLRRGMFGLDINKKGTPGGEIKVPESLGLVTGVMFVLAAILFQFFQFSEAAGFGLSAFPSFVNGFGGNGGSGGAGTVSGLSAGGAASKSPVAAAELVTEMGQYNAALFSITFQVFLGFVDDVLDVPWRVKLVLPTIAALPLLMSYAGHTAIVVPKPLRATLGGLEVLELGLLYKVYMVLLSVFCTNSINIYAGINGLEAGQTLVMAVAVLCHNLKQLSDTHAAANATAITRDAHLFSAYLMMPLAGTTLGLLVFNWFPSRVFVGDTFTYFAGMVFAAAGIMGHFSETLLLFFLPQIVNFVYSIPQLLKIVPCPRHRLPTYNTKTGLLEATPNMNLVNLALRVLGPTSERALCAKLLVLQAVCCAAAFLGRYLLVGIYK